MASLNDRVRALEEPGGDYPPHIVASALQRIPTEELKSYVAAMGRVVDGGFPKEEAEPAVRHIIRLCEKVKLGR